MHSLDRKKIALMMCITDNHESVGAFANALECGKDIKVSIDMPRVSEHIIKFFKRQQYQGIQWYSDAHKKHVTWFKISPNVEFARFVYAQLGEHMQSLPVPINTEDTDGELTGLSVNYYQVNIEFPTTPGRAPYTAECNDIIEALGMTPAEANIFKETWRTAAARTTGKKKKHHDMLYAYEKVFFFAKRQYELLKFNLEK